MKNTHDLCLFSGPPGCLQYFTGTFGVIASYAFTGTAVVAGKSLD